MSLLSICQEAAAEIGVSVPSSIIGNGEATAVRLLAAARREIFGLSRAAAWSALVGEHDFAAAAGASAQPDGLPADFDYVIDGTAWDRGAGRRLNGPLSAQAWQALRAAPFAAGPDRGFRIFGGAFHIHPPAAEGGRIAYEYVSNRIVAARGGGRRTGWLADDDSFVLSEALATMGVKWRFKKAIGLAYDDDLNEYLSMLARLAARDGGRATLRLDGAAGPGPPFVPDGDFPEGRPC